LRSRPTRCRTHRRAPRLLPTEVLGHRPAAGAVVFVWSYGLLPSDACPRDFPERPRHFRLGGLARYE
jgi:hypothetical protein